MGAKSRPLYIVEVLEKRGAENLESQVPEGRADFKAMESALNAQEMIINAGRVSYLPRLNAFASYMLNDKTAFGFGSNSYLVGAQFSWNLFNGTSLHHRISEQKIVRAKIERQLNHEKEQSQLELSKTLRQLRDSQFALQQHEISVNQATEALRILRNRFEQGLVSINDLLQAQSTLSEQELLQSEAIFKYNTSLAYMKYLTTVADK